MGESTYRKQDEMDLPRQETLSVAQAHSATAYPGGGALQKQPNPRLPPIRPKLGYFRVDA